MDDGSPRRAGFRSAGGSAVEVHSKESRGTSGLVSSVFQIQRREIYIVTESGRH